MSFTHKHLQSVTLDSGSAPVIARQSITADAEINIDAPILANTPDQLVNIAFAIANLKSFFLVSDQDLTLETNSSGAPQETIVLEAGVPIEWYTGGQVAVPFAGNITKFYFTSVVLVAATVQIRALVDSTP